MNGIIRFTEEVNGQIIVMEGFCKGLCIGIAKGKPNHNIKMEKSVFVDKNIGPEEEELKSALGKNYVLWNEIKAYVLSKYPQVKEEWHFPGAKYGWSFRMKDKKRTIIYFIPMEQFFQVAFVFGGKATETILNSNVSEDIKHELKAAKVYVEGRGIRVTVREKAVLEDIRLLIDAKLFS